MNAARRRGEYFDTPAVKDFALVAVRLFPKR